MTKAETFIIGNIDRRRERECSRDARTARRSALDARAEALIGCAIRELPETDHADFCTALASAVRARLVEIVDAPGAASILAREAAEAGRDILPRAIAIARAEQLFTTAANDRSDTSSEHP